MYNVPTRVKDFSNALYHCEIEIEGKFYQVGFQFASDDFGVANDGTEFPVVEIVAAKDENGDSYVFDDNELRQVDEQCYRYAEEVRDER